MDKINSLRELYKYISGALIFLFAVSLNYENRIRVIKTIVLAGFLISLLAIYQYFFGFRHTLEFLSRNEAISSFTLDYIQRKRVYFPFVTPNTLGGYLAIIIPLIWALWDRKKKLFLNPSFFFLLTVSFALLLTKSLGALLSIFLGLILYFYLHTQINKGYLKRKNILDKKRLLLIVALLIIIALVFLIRQAGTKQHILPSFSLVMRLNYWKDTLKIIIASVWKGVGLGNFNLPVARYAHNSYLQVWAEMGILGIISILWLISAVFKSAFENLRASPNKKLITGLLTANAVFLIHNLVDFSFFLPEVALIWWTILGLSIMP
ncbi:MAG: O-antigen ligase family protein [Candidatus Omnitrophica bacterium]|nr:O-antigen ligase family protein [Candidatus Omnitrophota bacterium]